MSKKKGLPRTIYVVRKEGGHGEKWLEPAESIEEFAEIGEVIEVGVYELARMRKIKGTVEVVK